MKIMSGHPLTHDEVEVAGKDVRFVAEDGRTMFEVSVGKDGASIEVRAVDNCAVAGVLYANTLVIRPHVANSLTLQVPRYDEG